MNVLIDGVFFQLANSGIARVWSSLIPRLAAQKDLRIFILDRGGTPRFPGAELFPFPSFTHTATAADSALIQKFCDHLGIDVFVSTYYTSPLTTPSVLIIYDMIPELFHFDLSDRVWKEKGLAIHHARRILSISECTRRDLHRFYPNLPADHSAVAHIGWDRSVFSHSPASDKLEGAPKQFDKPYLLLVGSRMQNKGYKNCGLLFDALQQMGDGSVDVVCAGGEPEIQPEFLAKVPAGCRVTRHDFADPELAAAYRGAIALVFPSLYEGFGLPVLEAMACGCPVITTALGSLPEVAGDAALVISGHDVSELVEAVRRVRNPETRRALQERGLRQASRFTWDAFTDCVLGALEEARQEAEKPAVQAFYREWSRLRAIQASVDVETFVPA